MSHKSHSFDILYIGTLPPHPGGSAISGSQLLLSFASLGHRIRALAPLTTETYQLGDIFAANHPEIEVTRWLVPYFETSPDHPSSEDFRRLEGEQIRQQLSSLMKNERPDIVFIGRETFVWHVPDITKDFSVPCILRLAGGTTLGMLNGTYPDLLAHQLLEQYRKVNLLVSPAKHLAKRMQRFKLPHIKIIANAVDLYQFSPRVKDKVLLRELALQDDDLIVAHISNLKALKRPLDLILAAEQVLQHNPQLVFLIVGDGPCREIMEQECQQRHILERFRFVGWVDYERVPDYMNLADLVVMPAEDETQARVYLETQACGRLLLASDIPAAHEVIMEGETGLLFRKGEINDLTDKILWAASNPQLRADIGYKARERVKAHSLDAAVAAYIATIKDIVQTTKKSRGEVS